MVLYRGLNGKTKVLYTILTNHIRNFVVTKRRVASPRCPVHADLNIWSSYSLGLAKYAH